MNHIYRLVWNATQQAYCAVTETAKGRGKSGGKAPTITGPILQAAVTLLIATGTLSAGATGTSTLPTGGQVAAGTATISSTSNTLTVNQVSQRAAINWQSFNIGSGATVNFVQPSASSVVLNRVVGNEQSVIAGAMNANGQVFLLNSNGVLFTGSSSVNVGGLVASTLHLSDADFMAARNTFGATGSRASVINLGTINAAESGYVALLGNQVKNEGVITARLGTAVMAAGDQVSLNFNGNSLVGVTIDQGTLNALVENKQAIRADGGLVVLTAKGLDAVMATVVNNTGEVRAQTIENKEGKIYLLGGMDNNRIEVGGTLDASAPNGGNGGFVETSAARVKLTEDVAITTAAVYGTSGEWLIDPLDFTIAASGGDITGAALGTLLGSNSIQIETATSPAASATNLTGSAGTDGDIHVNDTVSWSSNNTLTLNAYRNININADITATGATGKLALYYGQGAVAASNTANYTLGGGHVNLQAGQNFDTKLGSDGTLTNWTVITALGAAADASSAPATMTLQGMTAAPTGKYVLGANIDASPTSTWNSNGSGGYYGFSKIGSGSTAPNVFSGKLDGLGHTIDGLYINRTANTAPSSNIGLFGHADFATIQNLSLTNANVTGYGTVGALAGSTLFSTIRNVYVSGQVTGGMSSVGGLIGSSGYSTVSNTYSTATVAAPLAVGGLIGQVTGGSVSNSYASGAVSSTMSFTSLGGAFGDASTSNVPTITNVYFDSTTTGQTYTTGGTGPTTGAITNADAYTQANYSGFDFTSSGAWFSVDGFTRPFLRMEATNNISNAHQLQLMSMNLASNYTLANGINLAPSLTNKSEMWKDKSASVDYSNYKGSFVPVGLLTNVSDGTALTTGTAFTGNFDGSGHTIDRLFIDQINVATSPRVSTGLFGTVNGSILRNVSFANVDITGGGFMYDAAYVVRGGTGALVGHAINATVSNVHVTGDADTNLIRSAGMKSIGGLIGDYQLTGNSSISDVSVNATLTAGHASHSNNVEYIGGIVGKAFAESNATHMLTIDNATFNGAINDITSNGMDHAGGIVGYGRHLTVKNSTVAATITGNGNYSHYFGGIVGELLASSTQQAGTMQNNSLENNSISGTILGSKYVGGVGGQLQYTNITNTHSSATITYRYDDDYFGGLVGVMQGGDITDSSATGNVTGGDEVVGGLVGELSRGAVLRSFATGNVTTADTDSSPNLGGLIGYAHSGVTITESYATGNVMPKSGTPSNENGGLIGKLRSQTGQVATITNSYASGQVGSAGDPFSDRVGGLIGYLEQPTGTATISNSRYSGAGVYGRDQVGGLIGYINFQQSGNIALTLVNRNYSTGVVTGRDYVGGLLGQAFNTQVSESYASGNVSGTHQVGGLVGELATGYTETTYYSNVTGIDPAYTNIKSSVSNSYARGSVTATGNNAGGLAGRVLYADVTNSYASGAVGAATNAGGLIGTNVFDMPVGEAYGYENGGGSQVPCSSIAPGSCWYASWMQTGTTTTTATNTVTNSFWDTQTSGQSTSAGGTGKTTTQMKRTSAYSTGNWSIATSIAGSQYPTLLWPSSGGSPIWQTYAAPISIGAPSVATREYNGSTAAPVTAAPLSGVALGDVVNVAAAGTYSDANVGTGKSVAVTYTLTGANALDYIVPNGSATGTIIPKVLAVTGTTVANKTYNGSAAATVTAGTVSGMVGNEAAPTVTASGTFDNANAGTGKSVTVTYTLSNTNYSLADETQLADILQKALSITGTTTANKTYDGGTAVTVTAGTVSGMVGNEGAPTVTASGTFANANAGTGKSVTVTYTLDNTNYSLADETLLANILQQALAITASNATKVYGQTPTLIAFTSNGLVNSETIGSVTLTSAGTAATAGVANGPYTITASDATGGTFNANNYAITYANGTLNITPKPLTVTPDWVFANDKPYDGTMATTVDVLLGAGRGVITGLVGNETVGVDATGTFANSNAGFNKSVTANFTLSNGSNGGLASNYSMADTQQTANILRREITVTGSFSANNKVYDGSAAATFATNNLALTGVVAGEALDLSGLTLAFNNKDVGTNKTVSLGGGVVASTNTGSASNYNFSLGELPPTTTADITPGVAQVEPPVTNTLLEAAIANSIITPQIVPAFNGNPSTDAVPPGTGQPSGFVNVVNPLPSVTAVFGAGERFAVVSSPRGSEPTQAVTLSQARSMMQGASQGGGGANGGDREVRVPVSRNSLADIVNGGLRLPDGVEQELFVVQSD